MKNQDKKANAKTIKPKNNVSIRIKNKILDKDFETFKTNIHKQLKIYEEKDLQYKIDLQKYLKKIENFRRLQFETENEFKLKIRAKSFESSNENKINDGVTKSKNLDGRIQIRYDENHKNSVKFKAKESIPITSSILLTSELTPLSYQNKESKTNFHQKNNSIENKVSNVNKNKINNARLSLVLCGRSNQFYVYKFNENGFLDKTTHQPIVRSTSLDFDFRINQLEMFKRKMCELERKKNVEYGLRIKNFFSKDIF
ncbi:unnamed protein product [Brachionus calyciflorus]|uniref:Uncharacterized protein n=1 Tax=Brachionus calyciflorus TaxID=104777 RepID=A0A813YWR8_9BILA|nr:unnamed protein product [Brachionus calyciflorus]